MLLSITSYYKVFYRYFYKINGQSVNAKRLCIINVNHYRVYLINLALCQGIRYTDHFDYVRSLFKVNQSTALPRYE